MALSYASAGVANAASGASPTTIATTVALAVGDVLVVAMAYDNSGGGGADPLTAFAASPAAGAMTIASTQTGLNDPGTASSGLCARVLAYTVTTAIPSGTNISVTWTGTNVVRAIVLTKVSSNGGAGYTTAYRTNSGAAGTNVVASAAPALTTPSVTSGELVLCWAGHENGANITGDADTTNGTWGTIVNSFNGASATGMALGVQGKTVTATATQAFNPTGTSSDWILGALIFTEVAPPATLTQAAYRFYDDGTEAGSVARAAQDTATTGDLSNGDGEGLLRVRLQSTNVTAPAATDDWQLQSALNGGAWVSVPSAIVGAWNSASLTEGQATTNRLGAGTGSFVAGKVSEDGVVDDLGWTAGNYTELLYSVIVRAAGLVHGDVLTFRVLRNGATTGMTYTATPTVNVVRIVTTITATRATTWDTEQVVTTTRAATWNTLSLLAPGDAAVDLQPDGTGETTTVIVPNGVVSSTNMTAVGAADLATAQDASQTSYVTATVFPAVATYDLTTFTLAQYEQVWAFRADREQRVTGVVDDTLQVTTDVKTAAGGPLGSSTSSNVTSTTFVNSFGTYDTAISANLYPLGQTELDGVRLTHTFNRTVVNTDDGASLETNNSFLTATRAIPPKQWGASKSNTPLLTAGDGSSLSTPSMTTGLATTQATARYHGWTLANTPSDFIYAKSATVTFRAWFTTITTGLFWVKVHRPDGTILAGGSSTAGQSLGAIPQSAAEPATSTTVSFTYIDQSATKADWDGAIISIGAGHTHTASATGNVGYLKIGLTYSTLKPAVRTFGGANNFIRTAFDPTKVNAAFTGAQTFVAVVNVASNGNNFTSMFSAQTSANVDRTRFDVVTQSRFYIEQGSASNSVFAPLLEQWQIVVATKTGAGSQPVRWHQYNFTTSTWTHAAAGQNIDDTLAVGAGGSWMLGRHASEAQCLDGSLAAAAYFDSELTDPQIETLVANYNNWIALNPSAMWVLDQASTATAVTDASGHGADQTSVTGTTVTLNASPMPAWTPGPGTTPVSATRSTTWNVASSGLTAVTASRSTAWDTEATVTATRPTTWHTRAAVTATRATTWNVAAAVTTTRATTWNVRQNIAATARVATWNVSGTLIFVATTRATTWNVRATVTTPLVASWRVLVGVTPVSRSAVWNVNVAVATTRATTWNVNATAAFPFSDDFERADGPAGPNYEIFDGDLGVVSGTLKGTFVNWGFGKIVPVPPSADQYVQYTSPVPTAFGGVDAYLRQTGTLAANSSAYVVWWYWDGGSLFNVGFAENTAGVSIGGAEYTPGFPSAPFTVRGEIVGTTWRLFLNGTQLGTGTLTAFTGANRMALDAYDNGRFNSIEFGLATPTTSVSTSRSTLWNVGTLLWKGVGVVPDGHVTADNTLLDVSWFYDWASYSVAGHQNDTSGIVQYVPMMWGDWVGDPRWGTATGDGTLGGDPASSLGSATILLGFNEPDEPAQSAMTVSRALALWPQLEATGARLGSPAPSGNYVNSLPWLSSFMSGNGGPAPRVDFLCLHWYSNTTSASGLGDFLDSMHNTYGKPIWLTETTNLQGNVAGNATLVPDVMAVLATRPWVERVAWFIVRDNAGWPGTQLIESNGALNAAGTAYASYAERIPAAAGTTTVTATRSTTWLVNATVSTSRAATWTTRSTISTTRAATWNTRTNVAATPRAASWNTLTTAVSTPRTGIWTVRTPVSTAAATTWRVLVPVVGTVSRPTTWVVRSQVTTTRAASWNTLVPVAATVSRATIWNTKANVATAKAATWDTKASVAASRAASWAVLASVPTSRPTTWAVWVQVTKTAATLWNVNGTLAFVSTSRATTWVVRASVSTSRGSTWNTAQGVATSRVASWNVAGAAVSVSTSRATTWVVRQSITTSRAGLWTVCTPVTATPRATTWRVLTTTTATARSTTWRVLAVVATSKTGLWNVNGSMYTVVASRSTTWSTRALVSTARPTSWAVDAAVVTACLATWRVLAIIATQRSARWNVATPISRVNLSRSTTWNVAPTAPVTDYLVLLPSTVMYLGENLIKEMYQGSVKIWPTG